MFAILIGAVFGFIVGLTSVGSGTFFGLAMLLLFPLSARRIVGTDMLHAALLLWVAGVGHLLHGNVDLHAIAWLLVGSIPGVLIGSHLSIRVPERALRIAFGFVLILSGIKIVKMPYSDPIDRGSRGARGDRLPVWSGRHAADAPGAGAPASRRTTPHRIPRAWPGSCRRCSSSPCSRGAPRPSR